MTTINIARLFLEFIGAVVVFAAVVGFVVACIEYKIEQRRSAKDAEGWKP